MCTYAIFTCVHMQYLPVYICNIYLCTYVIFILCVQTVRLYHGNYGTFTCILYYDLK